MSDRKEVYGTDPQGNVMPQGMFWRDGVYYVRVTIKGKRQKISTGQSVFKLAMLRYSEIMVSANKQEMGWETKEQATKVPTLKDYWFKVYRPKAVVGKKTPAKHYGNGQFYRDDTLVKNILFQHGHELLSWFTTTRAQDWADDRLAMTYARGKSKKDPKTGVVTPAKQYPMSKGTVAREVDLLQAIFERAMVKHDYIKVNPWVGVEREDSDARNRVLTLEEQDKLSVELTREHERWMLFLLGTGLRLEELRAIDDGVDLNFPERWINVVRKTRGLKKKVQKVPLIDDCLLDILQEQFTEAGQLWHGLPDSAFRTPLEKAAKRAGIEHITPHGLRHTFATRYLRAGGDIYHLSKILGHASVAITEKVYAHLLGDDLNQLSRARGINVGIRPKKTAKVLSFAIDTKKEA